MSKKIRVGISIGDPNGIGSEIIIKTFMDKRINELCTPVIYGSSKLLGFARKHFGFTDFNFNILEDIDKLNHKACNVLNCWNDDLIIDFGVPSKQNAKFAFTSLKTAVEDLASNKIDVLVTAPIDKHTIQSEDFEFPGHTEYLANYANEDDYLMMMVGDGMRLALVTSHVPLKDVEKILKPEEIVKKIKTFDKSLRQDFNIDRPKIAVLGLNPHAGDNGVIGDFEKDVLEPVIEKIKNNHNILAFGPYAADGFFGSGAYKRFDAVLAMYHDQGLVGFKSICFDDGVNFTAGLPIVRTSPDHGVAYDIAGKNIADPSSFRSAVFAACDIYKNRKMLKELKENQLGKFKLHKEEVGEQD